MILRYHKDMWLLTLFLFISTISTSWAQTWRTDSEILKRGDMIIDSIALVDWPETIPAQAAIDISTLEDWKPISLITGKYHHRLLYSFNPENRAHVAAYHCPDFKLDATCRIWRYGVGLQQLKIPIGENGIYYIITIAPYGSYIQVLRSEQDKILLSDKTQKSMIIAD